MPDERPQICPEPPDEVAVEATPRQELSRHRSLYGTASSSRLLVEFD